MQKYWYCPLIVNNSILYSAGKTLLVERLMIFFLQNLSPHVCVGNRGSAETWKGTNKYQITEVKSKKLKSFRDFRQNITPVKIFQQPFVLVLHLSA